MSVHSSLLACLLLLTSTSGIAGALKVTTFNIEFYGRTFKNTNPIDDLIDDRRDATLREFLEVAQIDSDVIAFQEILDTESLQQNVLEDRYLCHTYDHSNRGHQHVVICHKPQYRFRIAANDDNYAWEDVAMQTLRPAVHGILTDLNGRDLAHLVALHLKAMPDDSDRRLAQTRILATNLTRRGDTLPIILLGDMNTFYDDVARMSDIYAAEDVALAPVDNPFAYTYRTNRYSNKLDWVWISPDIELITDPIVAGPCNSRAEKTSDFEDLAFYNANVSDHCPVTVELMLPEDQAQTF